MKKIILILVMSIYCLGNNDLNQYLNSKEYLKSIKEIETYVTSNRETTLGYNVISITMLNKENKLVEFKVLKEIPLVLTKCDFKIEQIKDNNFNYSFDNECYKILSISAQNRHVFNIINSIEKQIEFMYQKGDTDLNY